ncbi:MAG: HEAT repeat domain-containing protein [Acidobacteriota bacterium]
MYRALTRGPIEVGWAALRLPALLLSCLLVALPTSGTATRPVQLGGGSPEGFQPADLPLALPADLDVAATLLFAEDRRELSADLLRLTSDQDPTVRARAALAIGRVGLPRGVPRLLELLRDPAPPVRALAAFGLGLIEMDLAGRAAPSLRTRATEALAALLTDPVVAVAAQAAWSIGMVADAAGKAPLAALLSQGAQQPAQLQAAALGAWWRIPGAGSEPLLGFLSSSHREVRLATVKALGWLADPNAQPSLVRLIDDPDPAVRAAAVRGLRSAPLAAAQAHAVRLLADVDWRVAAEALAWLAAAWEKNQDADEEVVTAVLRASMGRNPHLQRLALTALGKLARSWPVALDRLRRVLKDPDGAVRAASVAALAAAGTDTVRQVLPSLRDRYGIAGSPAAKVVGGGELPAELSEAPLEAAAVVQALAVAEDRQAAAWLALLARAGPLPAQAEALRQWQLHDPARAGRGARQLLASGQPALQGVAAEVTGLLASAGTLPPTHEGEVPWGEALWQAQLALQSANALEPRLLALDALGVVASSLLKDRSGLLLKGEDRVVRLWTFRYLRRTTPPDVASDPSRWEREEVEANRVLGPLDTGATLAGYRTLAAGLQVLRATPPHLLFETPRGSFEIELQPSWAPLAVLAMLGRAREGFFDGVLFHRAVPDFMIQAGDPTATGYGSAPGALRNEETPVAYRRGTVGLTLSGRDTGSSQFFIVHGPEPQLTGVNPALGRVVRGQRAVDRIQAGDSIRVSVLPSRVPHHEAR